MDVSFNMFPTIKMSKLTPFSICAVCQTSKRWPKFLHCEVMMLKMLLYFSLHTKCTFFFSFFFYACVFVSLFITYLNTVEFGRV